VTDRGDRVVRAIVHGAVVLQPDLHPVGKTRLADPRPREVSLFGGQRDAHGTDPVLPRGVQHQAPPAAADVQQPSATVLRTGGT